jgi:hypothetical protein
MYNDPALNPAIYRKNLEQTRKLSSLCELPIDEPHGSAYKGALRGEIPERRFSAGGQPVTAYLKDDPLSAKP